MKRILLSALLLLGGSFAPPGAGAQQPEPTEPGWNTPRALELIRRAQDRRLAANADSGLTSYRSDARIFVYFYLDRPDTGERNLVKTDQLALEVYWQAPDLTKQRIVGWRDEKSLPTNISYHLDHLTVVQENFGDEIRLGDGDEVTDVVHPATVGAEEVYEYRLVDSLTLRLPGAAEPVRVYELQVRPLDLSSPGFVGSVFVEQRAGDIVRMDFTFTESSYVDRYLDYINISLDNGLWQGQFWLPNEQRVEIRRRIPELDIPAGSVIRANMQVGNYAFDEPMPFGFFSGDAVIAAPPAERESFPFEEDIHAQVREEGIGPQAELGEIRRLAAELMKDEARRRSTELRLQLGAASETFRYNRTEGVVLATGVAASPIPGLGLAARVGYAFGAGHGIGSVDLASRTGTTTVEARLYANEPRDMGIGPAASGALNSLAAALAGQDYTDPYYVGGGALALRHPLTPAWTASLEGWAEQHRSPEPGSSFSAFGDLRPVRGIDPTDLMVGGRLALRRVGSAEASSWLEGELAAEIGTLAIAAGGAGADATDENVYWKPTISATWGRRWLARGAELRFSIDAGAAFGDLPQQELYLIGGRGTAPGYDFRAFAGDRFASARGVYSVNLSRTWLRGRFLAAAAWSEVGEAGSTAVIRSGLAPSREVLPSVGLGLGIFHDIIRVDVARGLRDGGRWELIVEANEGFWDFL